MLAQFPIRTTETLRAAAPQYFKRTSRTDKGFARTPLHTILLTSSKTSMFIVRIPELELVHRLSHHTRKGRTYVSAGDYYRVSNYHYLVAEIQWADGSIQELTHHATRDEAYAALHKLHAAR